MALDIQRQDWAQADLDEMARLAWEARQVSPLRVDGQTLEEFRGYLLAGKERWPETVLLCARQGQELLGWLGLITADPLVFELWRWHPFLKPGIDPGPVAQELLLASIRLAQDQRAQSLEVCCHLNQTQLEGEAEEYARKQGKRYLQAGMIKTDETVYMTCSAMEFTRPTHPPLPESHLICDYHPSYREPAYACYLEAFSAGSDRSFLHKTPQQQEASFQAYLDGNLNTRASKLLLIEGQVRGISLVQSRERVGDEHLALLAVSPGFQGQGWGRLLGASSLEEAARASQDTFSVGVDLANQPALLLYENLGFRTQTKLITYTWKNNQL